VNCVTACPETRRSGGPSIGPHTSSPGGPKSARSLGLFLEWGLDRARAEWDDNRLRTVVQEILRDIDIVTKLESTSPNLDTVQNKDLVAFCLVATTSIV
jgi:hypothetical protein